MTAARRGKTFRLVRDTGVCFRVRDEESLSSREVELKAGCIVVEFSYRNFPRWLKLESGLNFKSFHATNRQTDNFICKIVELKLGPHCVRSIIMYPIALYGLNHICTFHSVIKNWKSEIEHQVIKIASNAAFINLQCTI